MSLTFHMAKIQGIIFAIVIFQTQWSHLGGKRFSGGSGIRTLAAWRLLIPILNPTTAGHGHFELLGFPPMTKNS